MEKLIVKPNDVRCLGDIVSPKSLSDFEAGYNSLTKGSDTVDGASSTVYISDYMAQCHFEISSNSRFIPYTGQDSFEVTTALYLISAWTHGSISDATVKCYLDDVLIGTGTTDSTGHVSFTIPISERTVYPVKFVYDGGRISIVEESCGCSLNVNYVVAEASSLTLIGEENIIQSGDTDNLLVTLTGTGVDGKNIRIPGVMVTFYRIVDPVLSLSASPTIIQSGEQTNITAKLTDSSSHEGIRGQTVTFYQYNPHLFYNSGTKGKGVWDIVANISDMGDGKYVSQASGIMFYTILLYDDFIISFDITDINLVGAMYVGFYEPNRGTFESLTQIGATGHYTFRGETITRDYDGEYFAIKLEIGSFTIANFNYNGNIEDDEDEFITIQGEAEKIYSSLQYGGMYHAVLGENAIISPSLDGESQIDFKTDDFTVELTCTLSQDALFWCGDYSVGLSGTDVDPRHYKYVVEEGMLKLYENGVLSDETEYVEGIIGVEITENTYVRIKDFTVGGF